MDFYAFIIQNAYNIKRYIKRRKYSVFYNICYVKQIFIKILVY